MQRTENLSAIDLEGSIRDAMPENKAKLNEIKTIIDKVSSLQEKIRDKINESKQEHEIPMQNWNQICSSLDCLEDTLFAITGYIQTDYPQNIELKYLYIYGLLQALFVQQDAMINLSKCLEVEFQPIKEIRDIRNRTIGHPTKYSRSKNTFSFHIMQRSLSRSGFMLSEYHENNSNYKSVDLLEVIKMQLTKIINAYNNLPL